MQFDFVLSLRRHMMLLSSFLFRLKYLFLLAAKKETQHSVLFACKMCLVRVNSFLKVGRIAQVVFCLFVI